MPVCPECNLEASRLTLHHDPPKSRIYKRFDGHLYFIDLDGDTKPLINNNNKKMCRKCHQKADRLLGLPKINPVAQASNIFKKIKHRRNKRKWHLKFGQGRVLYK